MGYRLKYRNLRIVKYNESPNGTELNNKYAVVEGNTLVSAVKGLSKAQAQKELKRLMKLREFKFTG